MRGGCGGSLRGHSPGVFLWGFPRSRTASEPVPASLMHICHRRQPPESPTEASFPGGRNPATRPSDHRPQHDCPVGFPLSTSEGCHASAAMGSRRRTGSTRQRCRQSSTLRERGSDCASGGLLRDRFRHRRPDDGALRNPVDVSRARRGGECSPLRRAQLRRPPGHRPAVGILLARPFLGGGARAQAPLVEGTIKATPTGRTRFLCGRYESPDGEGTCGRASGRPWRRDLEIFPHRPGHLCTRCGRPYFRLVCDRRPAVFHCTGSWFRALRMC